MQMKALIFQPLIYPGKVIFANNTAMTGGAISLLYSDATLSGSLTRVLFVDIEGGALKTNLSNKCERYN